MKQLELLVIVTTCAAVCVAGSAPARAQSAGAQAEVLFKNGRALMERGKLAEACAAFDASQKLEPATSTVMNQANCRAKNGELATAWGLFVQAARETRARTDAQGKAFNKVSTERAAALEPMLSTLTIVVESPVADLEVFRGEVSVEPGAWGQALPIDGGIYEITAQAPGYKSWSTSVRLLRERDAKVVKIPQLEEADGDDTDSPVPSRGGGGRSRTAPIILSIASVGLLGGALGFELSGRADYNASKASTDQLVRDEKYESAVTKRYVAQGMAAAGVVTAGIAVWLFIRSSGGDEPSRSHDVEARLSVQPILGSDQAGIQLLGWY
ncbi:MAG: tetratricopeptide repeat protein [Kofleriaceae bacterium]